MKTTSVFLDVGVATTTMTVVTDRTRKVAHPVTVANRNFVAETVAAFAARYVAMANSIATIEVTKLTATLRAAKANFNAPIQSFAFKPTGDATGTSIVPTDRMNFTVTRLVRLMISLVPTVNAPLSCGVAMVTTIVAMARTKQKKCAHI